MARAQCNKELLGWFGGRVRSGLRGRLAEVTGFVAEEILHGYFRGGESENIWNNAKPRMVYTPFRKLNNFEMYLFNGEFSEIHFTIKRQRENIFSFCTMHLHVWLSSHFYFAYFLYTSISIDLINESRANRVGR